MNLNIAHVICGRRSVTSADGNRMSAVTCLQAAYADTILARNIAFALYNQREFLFIFLIALNCSSNHCFLMLVELLVNLYLCSVFT